MKKYNSLLDSLRMSDSLDIEDPVVAANFLISKLPDKNYYYTSVTPYPFGRSEEHTSELQSHA